MLMSVIQHIFTNSAKCFGVKTFIVLSSLIYYTLLAVLQGWYFLLSPNVSFFLLGSSPSLSVVHSSDSEYLDVLRSAIGHLSSHIEGIYTAEVSMVNLDNYYLYCNKFIAFTLNYIDKLKCLCSFCILT